MEDLLYRFVGLYGQPLTPQHAPVFLEVVPAHELSPMPPIAAKPIGDIAEFYSRLQFEDYLYPPHGLSVFFNPYHKIREMAFGWAIEEDEASNIDFYPDWTTGECVFFATEIEDGCIFVQLETGVVYGMLTGDSKQYPLAGRFWDFLDALLQLADLEKQIPRYNEKNFEQNPDYQQRALSILASTLGEGYTHGFNEYFEISQ